MAASAPVTRVPRRSASLPIPRPSSGPDPQIEILFTLPTARIIDFQTSGSAIRPGSSSGDIADIPGEIGTLPWISRFERTIAVGPFRIYRAPGSVAFLNCQNALRPILPKSQCWAVDDDSSKFVLQIRPPQYWRIEIPNKTPEDKVRADELREVLGKVLRFEKTPCPFQRSFVVELPETPKTIKKIPWKPVERPKMEPLRRDSLVESREASPLPLVRRAFSSAAMDGATGSVHIPVAQDHPINALEIVSQIEDRQAILEASIYSFSPDERESGSAEMLPTEIISVSQLPSSNTTPVLEPSLLEEESVFADFTGLDDDSFSDATDDTNITSRSLKQTSCQSLILEPDIENRTQPLQHCSRSITAPPILSLITSPPSKHRTSSPLRISTIPESDSGFSSSVESFHSIQSWHSPLAPPSPPASGPSSPVNAYPYPHNNIILPKRLANHSRDVSEVTVTPETPRTWDATSSGTDLPPRSRSLSPAPKTPSLISSISNSSSPSKIEAVTPPTVRHRATTSSNSRRRELSPLPAAVNLFSPPRRRSRRLQTRRHLPTAIIQKTCEILLSPPSHLLSLMLKIASKIAAGEWRGVLTGQGESVHWDFEDEYAAEGWEDDYGISLPKTPKNKTKKATNMPGGSWEVD